MKKKMRRGMLTVLTFLPVVAVSFAAKSALNIDQINSRMAPDAALQNSGEASPTI